MQRWIVMAAAITSAVLVTPGVAAAGWQAPDPTPSGPQRPYEPDVAGPRNIDIYTADVRRDGGSRNGVEITLDRRSRAAAGGQAPAGARRFVTMYDKSVRFFPERFATCARTQLEDGGVAACPAGSVVGGGTIEVYPQGSHTVHVLNTRLAEGRRGVLVAIPDLGVLLEQSLERVVGSYRKDYTWAMDEIIPPSAVPPQDRAGSLRFRLTVGAVTDVNGRTASFAESTARPGSRLKFGVWTEFVTGQTIVPSVTARAPR